MISNALRSDLSHLGIKSLSFSLSSSLYVSKHSLYDSLVLKTCNTGSILYDCNVLLVKKGRSDCICHCSLCDIVNIYFERLKCRSVRSRIVWCGFFLGITTLNGKRS